MKEFRPVKIAVIGCGMISGIYMKNLKEMFNVTELVACSDIVPERSKKRAEEFGIKQMTNEEICEFVGYSRLQYFSTKFKDHFGVTPNEYRRQQQMDSGRQ